LPIAKIYVRENKVEDIAGKDSEVKICNLPEEYTTSS
jgi:hypothetical protein